MLKTIFPFRSFFSAHLWKPHSLNYGISSIFLEQKQSQLLEKTKYDFTTKKPKQNQKQTLIQKSENGSSSKQMKKLQQEQILSKNDSYFVLKFSPTLTKIIISFNLKVVFVPSGSTSLTKVQSLSQSNQPHITMSLNRSKHPPQNNKANEQIERFWSEIDFDSCITENLISQTKCSIVAGHTSKRKIAKIQLLLKNKLSQKDFKKLSQRLDTLIRSFY